MQRVLLIEDDNVKALNIREFIRGLFEDAIFHEVPSLVDAIDHVNTNQYDLVLVDMAIPSHQSLPGGGAPMSLLNGGLEILLELKALARQDRCVVVTQFHEVEVSGVHYPVGEAAAAISEFIECDVLGCIEYSDENDSWKAELSRLLK
jgi:CheY-like chemotaxis protein